MISLFALAACNSHQQIDIYSSYQADGKGGAWHSLDVQQILADHPPKPGWSIQVIDLERLPHMSTHLVRVKTRENLHYHDRHDATAIMLEGRGLLYIDKGSVDMKPGTMVAIPRRIIHEFVNQAKDPSIFFVTFSPPFDGQDRVRVQKVEDLLK